VQDASGNYRVDYRRLHDIEQEAEVAA